MAGWRPTFGENVNAAYQGTAARGRDLTNTIQSGMAGLSSLRGMAAAARDASKQISNLEQRASDLESIRANTKQGTKAFAELTAQINATNAALDKTRKSARNMGFDMVSKSLGGLTKKLLSFNTSLLTLGFDFLISSLTRVYELQERWAKAIGGFNMKLGGLTKGMKELTATSMKWSSTMRGLTNGEIDLNFFADFTLAMGGTTKAAQEMADVGLVLARGFNLQAAGAADLTSAFKSMGSTQDDVVKVMGGDMVSAANEMGVSVNMLAKDVQETSTYMVRFGKDGQKTFVQGAAFARKFFISMKEVKGAVESFDMFDDAAKTASKLNTAFGTMVNSMDLMMEDDPAKRIEMIRQQFLAQGKTFDTLQPKQVRYLAETMHLTEKQVAALLDAKNANVSYSDFKAKEAAKEKAELNAKRNMQIMLRKTTQTLFAFGVAFDRVTMAIGRAISPLLKVFGLAKGTGKNFEGFGKVMSNVTDTLVHFFDSLADNPEWTGFMEELAKDLIRAGKALKEFVMSGRAAKLVGELASTMKSFYMWVRDLGIKALPYIDKLGHMFLFLAKNVKYFALAWAGIKGFGMFRDAKNAISDVFGGGGGAPAGKGKGRVGRGVLGAAGAAVATIAGGGGIGAGIGGALGSLAGSFIPIIGPLLGPAGAALGGFIESLFGKKRSEVEKLQDELKEKIKKNADVFEYHTKMSKAAQDKQMAEDAVRLRSDKILNSLKAGQIDLSATDIRALKERTRQLQGFGRNTDAVSSALQKMSESNGPVVLTRTELIALKDASKNYNTDLQNLRKTAQELYEQQMGSIEVARAKSNVASLEMQITQEERALKERKATQKMLKSVSSDTSADLTRAKVLGGANNITPEGRKKIADAQKMAERALNAKNKIDKEVADREKELIRKKSALEDAKFKLEKQTYLAEMIQPLMGMQEFKDFRDNFKGSGMSDMTALKLYMASHPETVSGFGISPEDSLALQKNLPAMASGGIVTRPMRAMIGEAGPEAVIPLRSIARGRMGAPMKHGGQAATDMVNYANGGSGQSNTAVTSTVAEVHLDGHKVGRALVRTLITSR